jgi:hypothetical protein
MANDPLVIATKALTLIEAHERECVEHRQRQAEALKIMADDLKAIRSVIDQGKGGWRVIVITAAITSFAIAVAFKVAQLFGWLK